MCYVTSLVELFVAQYRLNQLRRVYLLWIGLDWLRLVWIGLDWSGLVWVGIEIGLDWFGFE